MNKLVTIYNEILVDFRKNPSSFNDYGWNIFVSSPVKQWPRTRFECVSSFTMTAVLKSFLTCSSPCSYPLFISDIPFTQLLSMTQAVSWPWSKGHISNIMSRLQCTLSKNLCPGHTPLLSWWIVKICHTIVVHDQIVLHKLIIHVSGRIVIYKRNYFPGITEGYFW